MKKNKSRHPVTARVGYKRHAPRKKKPVQTSAKETRCEGRFHGTRRGFGFVTPYEGGEDVFIPRDAAMNAVDGDTVAVLYRPRYGDRMEGRVVEILSPRDARLYGTLIAEECRRRRGISPRFYLFYPDDRHLPDAIPVLDCGGAAVGDKVEVRLSRSHGLAVRVLRSFGPAASFRAGYESVLAECGIEYDFEAEALAEAERRAAVPLSEEGRIRQEGPILTIDGADAKDLDDAVALRREGEGYLLSVHIADVSEYVTPRTALDRAAMGRGTSVYFVDQVVPMLPPALSNSACSLNAGEDKYTLSAHVTLSAEGEIIHCRVERGIICSDVRGVYAEVNDLLANGAASPYAEKYSKVYNSLVLMRELYEKLEQKAIRRGYTELESAEPVFLLDEQGFPTDVVRRERGVSERIIEHFMLTANEAVARLLSERSLPCVYRVHEEPPAEKLSELVRYLHNLGLDTRPLTLRPLTTAALATVLREADQKGLSSLVSRPTVRAMAKAKYADLRSPHFGLGLEYYCHFTSPIRRLSDLATHRILKACLLDGKPAAAIASYARRAAAAASERELAALQAERRIEALYKALWAEGHIGEEFDAVVSGVTAFGIFAELSNTVEGLIPMDELPFGAYFDEQARLVRLGRESISLGDSLRVRIEDALLSAARVRFALLSRDA